MYNSIVQFAIPTTLHLLFAASFMSLIMIFWKKVSMKTLVVLGLLSCVTLFFQKTNLYTELELKQLNQAQYLHDLGRWIDCNFGSVTDIIKVKEQYTCLGGNVPTNPPGFIKLLSVTKLFTTLETWKTFTLFLLAYLLFITIVTISSEVTHDNKFSSFLVLLLVGAQIINFKHMDPTLLSATIIVLLAHLELTSIKDTIPLLGLGSYAIYIDPTVAPVVVLLMAFTHHDLWIKFITIFTLVVLCVPLFFWIQGTHYFSEISTFQISDLDPFKVIFPIFGLLGFLKNKKNLLIFALLLVQGFFTNNLTSFFVFVCFGLIHFINYARNSTALKEWWLLSYLGIFALALVTSKAKDVRDTMSLEIPKFPAESLVFTNATEIFQLHRISSTRLESLLDDIKHTEQLRTYYEPLVYHLPHNCDPLTTDTKSQDYQICGELMKIYKFEESPHGHPFYIVKEPLSKEINENDSKKEMKDLEALEQDMNDLTKAEKAATKKSKKKK